MSTVIEEFSRFATEYNKYNIIQEKVAKTLIDNIPSFLNYKTILDVGCGSGAVFQNLEKKEIHIDTFLALDFSTSMLDIHPSRKNIIKIQSDFNSDLIKKLPIKDIEIIISSSALQWSNDLGLLFQQLSSLSSMHYYAIFTSNTFKTLHQTAKVNSPIYLVEELKHKLLKYYKVVDFDIENYQLEFTSTREMLKYIKKSGISGGERKLNYTQTKQLIKNYPLEYLEFEVLFVKAKN